MTLEQNVARPGAYSPAADDHEARVRILTDLDTNILVEAGAGSGKTTSLVGRMLALISRGTHVERIAAVTFTRKAANELRERLQLALETKIREEVAGGEKELVQRLERALRELDRSFVGTIHSFCARLLRERPLEVALDPDFREVSDDAWEQLSRDFWRRWIERARRTDDPALGELRAVGIDARSLYRGFALVMAYPDVDFSARATEPPDVASCRRELEDLLAAARALMPPDEPPDSWDPLMRLVRRLDFQRRVNDWSGVSGFCAAIERIATSQCKITQKRWSDTKEGKTRAKAIARAFDGLLAGPIADVLRCWSEHRYPIVMRFLRRASGEFARERHATGQLGFEDLLTHTATLLREHPRVRDELGARYAHVLVDEFQDTDPIQAELCFLLASNSAEGSDWRAVTPRPGALFVVGDPKQSIFRFRRADIQIYELVKERMERCGVVLALTRNFRSVRPIEELVNGHFSNVFGATATDAQAAFRPMQTVKKPAISDGVFRYDVHPDGASKEAIWAPDAAMVASWIARRIERGEHTAGSFLVLTMRKKPIELYARALSERNIPVATTGARLPQERELRELLVVLHAIADPENTVAVAAALEGLFFGLSPADLFDARQAGARFSLTHPPTDESLPAGRSLARLHQWWRLSQRHPADVLLDRILDDTGLLFHAASQPLGDARAGALLHMVEALRAVSIAGASGITDAMDSVELLLDADAADAPLRAGRTDAVRVMNLHKAKGLEADVVVLVAPVELEPKAPLVSIRRGPDERARGGIRIMDDDRVLAQPPGWSAMAADEASFLSAEGERLLYVAATRARRELVVAQCVRSNSKGPVADRSAWSPLAPLLDSLATQLELPNSAPAGRRRVTRSIADVERAIAQVETRRRAADLQSLRVTTVTASAREAPDASRPREADRADARLDGGEDGGGGGLGRDWGRAVHRALQAMGLGRSGEALTSFLRAVAREERLTADDVNRLESLLDDVQRSAAWQRLMARGAPHFELPVMRSVRDGERELITHGVIDAAAVGADGWLVVDWKTDAVDDATWAERLAKYTRQLGAYQTIMASLTGAAVEGTIERLKQR